MYRIVKSVVLKNNQFIELDVSSAPLSDLFDQYQEVYFVLTHNCMFRVEELKLSDIAYLVHSYSGSMRQYLHSIDNMALPTSEKLTVSKNIIPVEYRNIHLGGFTSKPTNGDYSASIEVPKTACKDVVLSRDNTDYVHLSKHCIFTVGGYVRPIDVRSDGVIVRDGQTIMTELNKDNMGMINLGALGEVSYLPIEEENVISEGQLANNYASKVILSHPHADHMDYHVFLVLGGLLLPFGAAVVTSESAITFDSTNYPFTQRYLEASKLLNFDNVKEAIGEEGVIPLAKLLSNEGIKAFFANENTFLIRVKRDPKRQLYVKESIIPHSGVRGLYRTDFIPEGFLYNATGKIMDVAIIECDEGFETSTLEDLTPNYIMSPKEDPHGTLVLHDTKDNLEPYSYSDAYEYLLYYLA